MNYAPVMDINNNPNNPVINDRSFGEDKYKVALFGMQYMMGLQDNGVMACAKHFPGHGDVNVDSHLDLPIIRKSIAQLDSTELFPFKRVFDAGISSTMIGHLFIPAIDERNNRPTSLSNKNIQGLLKTTLNYQGLTITDGIEMMGVKKFFPNGEASVQSIIAGNDLICIPDNIPLVVEKIKTAIQNQQINWSDIEYHCKRILKEKYKFVLNENHPIALTNLQSDLNKDILPLKKLIAENAITLLCKNDTDFFPLQRQKNIKIAYVGIGLKSENNFSKKIQSEFETDNYYFDFSAKNKDAISKLVATIRSRYKKVIIGIHQINRAPANNFGISNEAISLIDSLEKTTPCILFLFGNAYAAKNWCDQKNMIVCYEDDSTIQQTALNMLAGRLPYKGTLPVTVCDNFHFGTGITDSASLLPRVSTKENSKSSFNFKVIDSIAIDGIRRKAMPGCALLVVKKGAVIYQKEYGFFQNDSIEKVNKNAVYDLASVTKILATTIAIMKLYDEGRIHLSSPLGDYLPSVKNTNKENITIKSLLIHEGGMQPFIPYYKETLDANGNLTSEKYASFLKDSFSTRIASHVFLRDDIKDNFYKKILESPVEKKTSYIYSDNDFIFLGKVVEQISGMSLDKYVDENFYKPMQLTSIGYLPLLRLTENCIVPSTKEVGFRNQVLRGFVHDQGAAFLGGVAGHAGLFSNTSDIACLMQMLLNGGTWKGKRYLTQKTIECFTDYQSKNSRRGLGFDKPEKNNAIRADYYPAKSCSAKTFGHTGFTGTCAWADPENELIFVFLSNRIYPSENDIFKTLNIRVKILEAVYQELEKNKE
jgi:beta-glucosidase-like glycosyl hydrolase/CubicO group peptidase (beta-lactamase class C family)